MDIDALLTWSAIGTLCLMAVFAGAALFGRLLFRIRSVSTRCLLAALPLTLVALSVVVSIQALGMGQEALHAFHSISTGVHINLAAYRSVKAMIMEAIHAYQLQTAIAIGAFIILLFVEKKLLPRAARPPLWVLVKDARFRSL